MDVLKTYLDSLFAAWPRTAQVDDLKREMLGTMEEKYEELKREGRSEHESIGIVISEFGSIDELMEELGIEPIGEEERLPALPENVAAGYEGFVRRSALLQGLGWMLVLLGLAAMMLIAGLNEQGALGSLSADSGYLLAAVALFLLVVPAVGLFIGSASGREAYRMLDEEFELSPGLKADLERKWAAFRPARSRSVIVAACLGVLSPVAVLIGALRGEGEIPYGAAIMLALLGLVAFLFAYYGGIHQGYQKLLQTGEFTPEKKAENRALQGISAIVWSIALVVYFISGFVYQRWDVNWAVFPVTAVLFGAIGGMYTMQCKSKGKA
ncbi:permease prefix domain 1-containing protein [Saccharibacillus alkalitolerans]|uniref:DUF1129 domain-containing protein n=1 Tax=Saccharibacillus alkalitolerans TaxID=2705290 RepID=A0ABX0F562_9BACL|nr:permease prefix domain 1-containing protein [Saccharibacillus alkalitolerans]NGZ75857.1 hypothetical protein [Saccharibacillus alkalitolerans]